jgi:hypothetical protein
LWGLEFSEQACWLVALKPPAGWDWLNRAADVTRRGAPPEYILCELRRAPPTAREAALHDYQAFRRRLSPLAAACPQYFGKPLSFVRVHDTWQVTSFATLERRLDFQDGGEFHLLQLRPPYAALALGRSTPEAILPVESDCARWFSTLREVSARGARR